MTAGRAACLLCICALPACVSTTSQTRSIEMDTPRVSAGWVVPEDQADLLNRVLDERDVQRLIAGGSDALGDEPVRSVDAPTTLASMARAEPGHRAEPLADAVRNGKFPADAGKVIQLGRLSATELDEIVDALKLRYETELGYAEAGPVVADFLPDLPEGVARGDLLARSTDDGLRLIRLGYRRYLSQASQLWAYAVVVRPDEVVVNEDISLAEEVSTETLESIALMRADLAPEDLDAQIVQLSFIDANTALAALRGLGITTVTGTQEVPPATEFENLPIVAAMPAPAADALALVGGEQVARDQKGMFAIPNVASKLPSETVAGPTSQLLVLFHPAHPDQFSRVASLLRDVIDVPARQVFIEGMIIEISEEGLQELGIEWNLQSGPFEITLGSTSLDNVGTTLDSSVDSRNDFDTEWSFRIKALIEESKAEILARPSVITLDNRQATIRVGTDIPVATSQEGLGGGSSKISFDFRYIPTGILLNVRPRIDAEQDQVSMQIDTTVSSAVPGQDLEVRSDEGTLLASAPTIASRRVQTYARVANNTPLIIGGLISRERSVKKIKVPLLGDLPLVGGLFRGERNDSSKQEVIIVLTPYVLPERQRISRVSPKQEDVFDSFDYELFRDAYRLRESEVFDLTFLTEDPRLVRYKDLANMVVRKNFRLAHTEPFIEFAGDRVPGEHILVERMMYEVIKRLQLSDQIGDSRLIYFVEDEFAGYHVRFLEQLMAELGDGVDMHSFFERNPGKAVYITFSEGIEDARMRGGPVRNPVPEIGVVTCDSRQQWGEMLWNLNQRDGQGTQRWTILLQDPSDLRRLRRAIALKRIVQLNGGEPNLTLRNFSVGTMLQMPDLENEEVHVIDPDVARYFFHTEDYYQAVEQEMIRAVAELDEALRRPEIAPMLEGQPLPSDEQEPGRGS